MTLKSFLAGAVLSCGVFGAAGAHAVTLYSNVAPSGERATDTPAISDSFTAPGGPATASFTIDGYASLDGQNYYEDDFILKVNGAPQIVGTFNLGGGGQDVLYLAPPGATASNVDQYTPGQISFAGGQEKLVVPITLETGANTISFSYISLPGPNHAGFQGLQDEGWGIQDLVVANAVPEPATWTMMLAGFGGLGGALRLARRRRLVNTIGLRA